MTHLYLNKILDLFEKNEKSHFFWSANGPLLNSQLLLSVDAMRLQCAQLVNTKRASRHRLKQGLGPVSLFGAVLSRSEGLLYNKLWVALPNMFVLIYFQTDIFGFFCSIFIDIRSILNDL